MSTLPFDNNRRWARKNSQSWRRPRLAQQSRRPLFFAIACLLCLGIWHHSKSTSLSPNRQKFVQKDPDPFSAADKRTGREEPDWRFARSPVEKRQEHDIALEEGTILLGDRHSQDHPGLASPRDGAYDGRYPPGVVVQQPDSRDEPAGDLLSGPEILLIRDDASEEGEIVATGVELSTGQLQKGPVAVQANLDPETEKEPVISSPDQPIKEKIIEAEPIDHLSLEEKADSLPEIVHITFEDAVKDEVLHGWEDDWVAHASYDAKKWGKLAEPKIDFVYLCKLRKLGHCETTTDKDQG